MEYYYENIQQITFERKALASTNILAFARILQYFFTFEEDIFYNLSDLKYKFPDGYEIKDECNRWWLLTIPEYRIKIMIEDGIAFNVIKDNVANKIKEYTPNEDVWNENEQEPEYVQLDNFEERIIRLRAKSEKNAKLREQKKIRNIKKGLDKFNAENYKIFCKEQRELIKQESANFTAQDTARELGRRWQAYKNLNKPTESGEAINK
jgi:hypothetical protein